MEDECLCSSPVNWEFYYHQEGLEELKYDILQTSLEVEATILSAKEEITRRECELLEGNDALSRAIKEGDEYIAQCQKLDQEILQLQQQKQKQQIVHEDDGGLKKQKCSSSSSSSEAEACLSSECEEDDDEKKKKKKRKRDYVELPEKGKLLKAVIAAGPLLQTLLLAGGPLPQWQHPPPLLHFIDIPPPFPPPPPLAPYFLP